MTDYRTRWEARRRELLERARHLQAQDEPDPEEVAELRREIDALADSQWRRHGPARRRFDASAFRELG